MEVGWDNHTESFIQVARGSFIQVARGRQNWPALILSVVSCLSTSIKTTDFQTTTISTFEYEVKFPLTLAGMEFPS